MAIVNKAYYLEETKKLIKDAIVDKGVDITDETKFRDYANKIRMIGGGGSGDGGKELHVETRQIKDIIGVDLHGLPSLYNRIVIREDGTGYIDQKVAYQKVLGNTYSWSSYSTGWCSSLTSPRLGYSSENMNNFLSVVGEAWSSANCIVIEDRTGYILYSGDFKSTTGSPASYLNSHPLQLVCKLYSPNQKALTKEQMEQFLLPTYFNGTTITIENTEFSVKYNKYDGSIGEATSVDGIIEIDDSADGNLLAIEIKGKSFYDGPQSYVSPCNIYGISSMRSVGYKYKESCGGNFLYDGIHYDTEREPGNLFKYWCKCEKPEKIAINGKANVATDFSKMGLSMTYAICANPAVRLKDKIYLFGSGYDASASSNKIQIFDCKTEGFSFDSATAPMLSYGYIGACADDANNCIYIIGGHNGYSQYTQIYKYTPSAHTVEQWGNAGGQGWVQTHSKELFEGYAYCVCAPWSGSRVAYKYNPATKSSATIPQPIQIYNIFQIEDDLYAMTGGKILKLDKGANSFSIVVAEDALIQTSAAQFVEVINNKAYFLYGSTLRMWDPISNNVTQLLDCGVSLTSNQWSTSCSYENKIYVFGNSERYSKAIYKFVIQEETSDKSMRIALGNTELSFGETITLGTSGFYYGQDGLETKVDLLKYNEETNEWEVIV